MQGDSRGELEDYYYYMGTSIVEEQDYFSG